MYDSSSLCLIPPGTCTCKKLSVHEPDIRSGVTVSFGVHSCAHITPFLNTHIDPNPINRQRRQDVAHFLSMLKQLRDARYDVLRHFFHYNSLKIKASAPQT